MNNFIFRNPVKILFGKGMIAKIGAEIPADSKILVLYGGGSILTNGVYEQVMKALSGFCVLEFGGIPANPTFEKCMEALEFVRKNQISFILAVGGGSVIDAAKFIALAYFYPESDSPWEMMKDNRKAPLKALPIGTVLTIPATGSEMNNGFVLSRTETREKLTCGNFCVYPLFSVLDPEATYSLPQRQLRNGLVDIFVHVLEQYVTIPNNSLLQDRQAEALLLTIIEIADNVLAIPNDYNSRANMMWCAAQALNGAINRGVIMDWSTHDIGHRLTAAYNLDHAATLAIVLPGVWSYELEKKKEKLAQFGERVWQLTGTKDEIARNAILATENFFRKIGMGVRFSDYDIHGETAARFIAKSYESENQPKLGENRDITANAIYSILLSRA